MHADDTAPTAKLHVKCNDGCMYGKSINDYTFSCVNKRNNLVLRIRESDNKLVIADFLVALGRYRDACFAQNVIRKLVDNKDIRIMDLASLETDFSLLKGCNGGKSLILMDYTEAINLAVRLGIILTNTSVPIISSDKRPVRCELGRMYGKPLDCALSGHLWNPNNDLSAIVRHRSCDDKLVAADALMALRIYPSIFTAQKAIKTLIDKAPCGEFLSFEIDFSLTTGLGRPLILTDISDAFKLIFLMMDKPSMKRRRESEMSSERERQRREECEERERKKRKLNNYQSKYSIKDLYGGLYDVLGVTKRATKFEITKHYKSMVLQHHPDKTKGRDQEEQNMSGAFFRIVNEANSTLSDPTRRSKYDNSSPGPIELKKWY